jgi:large subunit ribosomal protein L13
MNRTFIPFSLNPKENVCYLINAENKTIGDISTKASVLLQGKNKISFYPSINFGTFVIIINSEKILVTSKKERKKLYYKHSGRPGGMIIEKLKSLKTRLPEQVLEKSIKKMLPKNSLGRKMFNRLKVFKDSNYYPLNLKIKTTTCV